MGLEKNKKDLLKKPIPDNPKYPADKKYKEKKPKHDWRIDLYGCPFCRTIRPEVTGKRKTFYIHKRGGLQKKVEYWEYPKRAKKCQNCPSRILRYGCPGCKGRCWYNKITKIYWDHLNGCGFKGFKKDIKPNKEGR